jgi:cytochrome c-type biogenesis protein CcmH
MPALVALLALSAFAPQEMGRPPLADPALEARVQALGKQLRCTVCQGMSIADSPAQTARNQLDKVRDLVSQGKSDQEVLDYFVERYDQWVLLKPQAEGFALLVWLGPALAIAGGLLFILLFIRGRNAAVAAKPAPAAVGPAASDDEYLRAVRAEVER